MNISFICQILILITLIHNIQEVENGLFEKKLLSHLFNESRLDGHDPLERPILNENVALDVHFKITLVQIIDVDEKNQRLKTNLWLDINWYDYHFEWDPINFNNVTTIVIPSEKVWRPDILLYNSADEKFDGTVPVNVVIANTGLVTMVPPGMFSSTCKINITYFPFDKQVCILKFGTWAYTGRDINLRLKCLDDQNNCTGMIGEADTSSFIKNGEWDIMDVPGKKNVEIYSCCPKDPYIDIKFYVKMKRRALYYVFNLITPCIIISTMSLLVFTLPPGAGEKISLGVTIMLSLTMFLFMVADKLPQTSSSVALIGLYFSCIMIMCSFSVVFTVLVLNCHHKSGENEDIPKWIKVPINQWLATILLMRPRNPVPDINKRRSSSKNEAINRPNSVAKEPTVEYPVIRCAGAYCEDGTIRNPFFRNIPQPLLKPGILPGSFNKIIPRCSQSNTRCSVYEDLEKVIKELQTITEKISDESQDQMRSNEWKFAARVIDRCCLIVFFLFTSISTVAILNSAPEISI